MWSAYHYPGPALTWALSDRVVIKGMATTAEPWGDSLRQLWFGRPAFKLDWPSIHVASRAQRGGALWHSAFWESQDDFEAFGPTSIPILYQLGVGLKEPMIASVHNVITG